MRVILLKDVAKVGQRGTMKEVADGYALNFLIARGLAVQATPEKVAAHEANIKREGEAQARANAALISAIQSIEGLRVETKVRATEKGGLFKSITTADIAKLLKVNIPEAAIQLEKPIKQVGEHPIKISAGGGKATITLVVVSL